MNGGNSHWNGIRCKNDGQPFFKCTAQGMRWRAHPAKTEPIRQWGRENLPRSLIIVDPDMLIRRFGGRTSLMLEVMTNRFPANRNLDVTAAMNEQRPVDSGFLRLVDGNVPTALQHWPQPCDCGCIDDEVVAAEVWLGGLDDMGSAFWHAIPAADTASAIMVLLDDGWEGIQQQW